MMEREGNGVRPRGEERREREMREMRGFWVSVFEK